MDPSNLVEQIVLKIAVGTELIIGATNGLVSCVNFYQTHIYQIGSLKSPKKYGRFDTRGSPVALLVPKISVEITFTLYSLIDLSGSR